jgi:hypothetical protein
MVAVLIPTGDQVSPTSPGGNLGISNGAGYSLVTGVSPNGLLK